MIRKAEMMDVDELVELGKYAHANGPFAGLNIDETSLRRSVIMSASMPNMCCYVAVSNQIDGVLTGVIGPNVWGNRVATDTGVFMRKPGEGAGLIKSFHKWAELNEAEIIAMSNSYGNERYNKLLEALKMKSTGNQYIKVFT